MKIQARNVVGKVIELTVEPSTTVGQVKDMLEAEYERQSLRLCLQGAVLEDTKTMEECSVQEGTVLILAGRKRAIPKSTVPVAETTAPADPPKAPEVEKSTSAPATTEAPAAATEAPVTAEAPATADPSPAVQTFAPAAPAAAPTSSATAGVDASLIDNLVSMGFDDREQVALALRAAYMNPDRAVDYLLSGIPPNLVEELTAGNQAPATSTAAGAGTSATQPHDLRTLLFTIPRFTDIRSVFQEDNSAMPTIMTQIASLYPHVYSEIEAHPDEFLAIMAETGAPATVAGGGESDGDVDATGLLAHMPQELELTAADRAAVQNLVQIGGGMWDEQAALLVYLATQRNQEVAASVLFEHGGVPPELLRAITEQMLSEDMENAEDYDDDDGNGEQ